MKIRLDFCSNSSSSSFVIGLPREPTDAIDLQHMLFGERLLWHGRDIKEIAERIWQEAQYGCLYNEETDKLHIARCMASDANRSIEYITSAYDEDFFSHPGLKYYFYASFENEDYPLKSDDTWEGLPHIGLINI